MNIEKKAKNCLELLESFEIILLCENKYILATAIVRDELLHLSSCQEEADAKYILHAYEILNECSSKVAIHSPSGDTILLLTLENLYEYKEIITQSTVIGNTKKPKTKQYYLRR